jgi:putative endonuclease
MFYAYVIKSSKFDFYYKGHCEDLDRRLLQHNSGMTVSIKQYTPFEIVYFEKLETREDAIRKEKYFKSAAGRRYLKNKLAR